MTLSTAMAALPGLLGSMTPAMAVALLTAGLLLIAWELNRPGSILPGALGLLGCLFAVAVITHLPVRLPALCGLIACVLLLAGNLLWQTPWPLLGAATAGLVLTLHALVARHGAVPWVEAVVCGGLLGGTASVLSRIALCARRAKQVN